MKIEEVRQILYLLALSVIGLSVLGGTSNLFVQNGWIIPSEFGQETLLRGIVSDLLIVLVTTAFLVVMAWLPDQLHGRKRVSFALVAAILVFEAALLAGALANFFVGDLQPPQPALWLGYQIREFVIAGVLPLILVEAVRRKLARP